MIYLEFYLVLYIALSVFVTGLMIGLSAWIPEDDLPAHIVGSMFLTWPISIWIVLYFHFDDKKLEKEHKENISAIIDAHGSRMRRYEL